MAKQTVGVGSSANDGTGDTLRTGAGKINDNFNEIYAEFGDGTNLSNANTSGDILVADGTKFVNRSTTGDITISNTGAINLRGNSLSIPGDTAPSPTSNKLYAVGSTLYWNGNTIGVAGGGSFSSFTVAGDSGSSQSVTDGNTLTVAGGTGIASVASATDTITLNIDSTVATLTGTQTLTSKSLTAPVLTGSSSSAGSILFREDTDNGTNAVTLIGPAATADVTVTLPAATGTIALTSDITVSASSTNTFTNKTFDADATGNNLTNVEDANIKTGANIAQAKLNLAITTAEVAAATLVVASEGIGSNNNDTTIPTSAAVKAYADSVGGGNSFTTIAVSGQNNVVADSGSDTLTLAAGSNVTLTTNDSTDTVTIAASGGGSSTLAGLSDTTIASSAAGQTLLYDGSNSYDNKQIKVMEVSSAFTAALPLMFGANIFTISGAASGNYTFQNYNSNGSDQDDPNLYLLEDHTYVFYLGYNSSSHPFHLVTGGGSGVDGTNLTASNGGDNIVHVDTDGTVTTGVAYYSLGAASRGRGWLIWKIPHFGAHQGSSTGDYGYQCSQHNTMYGQIFISSIDVLVSHD